MSPPPFLRLTLLAVACALPLVGHAEPSPSIEREAELETLIYQD